MKIVFRDDDINYQTDIKVLKHIHEQFLKHHKTHTIALICDQLEKNKELINYINSTTNWELCIHGWTHDNYSLLPKQRIEDELDNCILKIEELFHITPEKWYLPWNGWTKENGFDLVPRVADIAIYHGIDVDTDCDHISHFLKVLEEGKVPPTSTVYFHSWDIEDLKLLPNLFFLTEHLKNNKLDHLTNLQDLL